jgi:MFS family permease
MPLTFSILRRRDFRMLLGTRVFANMALQAQAVVAGWQIYSLTKDPLLLGLTGLAEAIPALACALFAGHIVDIGRPHRIYRYCMGVLTINTLILLLLAGGMITPPGGHLLLWIYGGIFVSGLARSFTMPASFSLLPQVVPRLEIPAASAWLGSGFQVAAISGPAIAGLVYGGYGPRVAWMLPLFFTILAFIMVNLIHPGHNAEIRKREPAMQSIKAGWGFILGNQILLSMMALDMFAVLFGGAIALLPAYADQVLHTGSQGLGILRAAPALGAIATALVLATKPMKKISAVRMLWVVTGFGFCMIGFGLSKVFWLSLLFLVLSGAFDSVSMVIRSTLMQLMTPEDMRGRVSSVNSMFVISSNEIGAFESGVLAKLIGLVPSVVAGGVATLLIVTLTAALSPQLRRTVVDSDSR